MWRILFYSQHSGEMGVCCTKPFCTSVIKKREKKCHFSVQHRRFYPLFEHVEQLQWQHFLKSLTSFHRNVSLSFSDFNGVFVQTKYLSEIWKVGFVQVRNPCPHPPHHYAFTNCCPAAKKNTWLINCASEGTWIFRGMFRCTRAY